MRFYLLLLCSLLFVCGCHGPRADIKKVKVGDVELAYYTRGSGEPLIMIMGFRGTMAAWDPALLELLEKKYQLILFDNRGVGFSTDTPANETSIEQMANDTAGLMKALGIEKAHILGWSMGSRIAIQLALNNPEMVDHLILCSPSPGGMHKTPLESTNAYKKLTTPLITPEEILAIIFPQTEQGKEASDAYVRRLMAGIASGNVPNDMLVDKETVKRQALALVVWEKDQRIPDKLKEIKNQTLVTGGGLDDLDSPENIVLVASKIPLAWSAFFREAGHNFISQDHERFADLVMLFTENE